ncbi:MAG: hypothetical protein O3C23_02600, partial [bacterium]|nr:hypothetical protein [bacterium]
MRKTLVLVVVLVILIGGVSFGERVDAAAPICGPCENDGQCDGDLICKGATEEAKGICQDSKTTQICNPLRSTNFTSIIDNILNFLFNVALVISPIMVV